MDRITTRTSINTPCLIQIDFPDRRHPDKKLATGQCANFALWNARSLIEKTHNICDSVICDSLDILCLTETWMSGSKKDSLILQNTLDGFQLIHQPRKSRGGGVGCLL